jgi:NAD(P)H-flavin reductase
MSEYIPMQAEIIDIDIQSPNTYLIFLKLLEEVEFSYRTGQFVMVSVFGLGECPISIASSPTRETLQLCIRRKRLSHRAYEKRHSDCRRGLRIRNAAVPHQLHRGQEV